MFLYPSIITYYLYYITHNLSNHIDLSFLYDFCIKYQNGLNITIPPKNTHAHTHIHTHRYTRTPQTNRDNVLLYTMLTNEKPR